jgi:hypothetical protein
VLARERRFGGLLFTLAETSSEEPTGVFSQNIANPRNNGVIEMCGFIFTDPN